MSRRHTKRERKYWPHSDPEPAPDFVAIVRSAVDEHVALDGAQACVLGCRQRGEHLPHCPCQDTCPDHDGHCRGCAPREAHGSSLLCGSCFHRRLRSPIRQTPRVERWLFGCSVDTLRSPSWEPRLSGTPDPPVPINVDVHDHLRVMRDVMAGWAVRVCGKLDDDGPESTQVAGSAEYLDGRAEWLSGQAWTVDLMASVADILNVARGLAPWEQTRTPLRGSCDRCGARSLVMFGGEDWVTCVNSVCDNVIGWGRYQNLERTESRARSEKVG
jgi:hypothetical protein